MARFWYEVLLPNQPGLDLFAFDTDSFTFALPFGASSLACNCNKGSEWWSREVAPVWLDCEAQRTRVPGRFHLESMGNFARAVGKKMYVVVNRGEKEEVSKLSHRGIRRECLPANPYNLFDDILLHRKPCTVTMRTQRRDPKTGYYVHASLKRTINPPST
jgi:hypothetical protein